MIHVIPAIIYFGHIKNNSRTISHPAILIHYAALASDSSSDAASKNCSKKKRSSGIFSNGHPSRTSGSILRHKRNMSLRLWLSLFVGTTFKKTSSSSMIFLLSFECSGSLIFRRLGVSPPCGIAWLIGSAGICIKMVCPRIANRTQFVPLAITDTRILRQ
ncbi:hypothetical protein MYP_3040 [Sporocytophaga myxococcoides]|uniref:Uncharacterized protein n=1 Tax=Sporocytophaga myxococcoides TaxID=153721 RepID=A0A098LFS1_9BACT|nr:hypothetical protein MYP_3040 [Sporocytophaga myxococcoides]